MTEIVLGSPALQSISASLERDAEHAAAIFLTYDAVSDRYLVHDAEVAGPADILSATEVEVTLAPQYLTRITRRARERGMHLAILHTHPEGCDSFSQRDSQTERGLADFMQARLPSRRTFAMVLCKGKLVARHFATFESVNVKVVGSNVVARGSHEGSSANWTPYDRQILAFGAAGQATLSRMTVAIVGLGGTGSLAAQQLAHLGVGRFILIDPDHVDETNLNRVVGTGRDSVGRLKIDVAAESIGLVTQRPNVRRLPASVMSERGRQLLCAADCIFICTDSQASRAFISELAYQYLIPAFDVGVAIGTDKATVRSITGRTQMLAPGLPCLLCSGSLDARAIREELMTPEQRAVDPYFSGSGVKQPAVISLNGTMVSLAVTMFLAAFTGIPSVSRWQSYDAMAGTVRALGTQPDPACSVCGASGIVAAGDSRTLNLLPAQGA